MDQQRTPAQVPPVDDLDSGAGAAAASRRRGFGRSLLQETATYSLGVAGAALIGFLAIPVYTRVIGPAGYGDMALALALIAPLSAVANLGLDVALSRFWFDRETADDRDDLVVSLLAFAGMWSAFLVVVGGGLVLWVSGPLQVDPGLQPLLLIVLAALLPTQVFTHAIQVLRNEFRPGAFVLASLTASAVGTGIGLLLVANGKGAVGALLGTVATGVAGCLIGLPLVRRNLGGRVRWAAFSPLLRLGLPLVPASLAFWVFSGFDRIVVADNQAGLPGYAVAAQVVLPLGLVVTAIGQAWLPRILAEHNTDPDNASRAVVVGTEATLAAFGALAAVVGLAAPLLIRLIAGTGYGDGVAPLPLLATGTVMLGASVLTATGALLAKKTARTPLITVAAAVVDIVALLLLVPRLGTIGAGLALLLAYSVMFWLTLAYSQSVFPLPFQMVRLAALYVVVVAQALVAAFWPGSPASWLAAGGPILWLAVLAVEFARGHRQSALSR